MMSKIAGFAVFAIPAMLLAAGITGETGKFEYGALVMVAFLLGRMSK